MALCTGRTHGIFAVKIYPVTKGTGIDEIFCVPVGNRAAPRSRIGRRSRGVGGIDIMTVLTAVQKRADLGIEPRVGPGSA